MLPDALQQCVQDGRLMAHAAVKYLGPLALATAANCLRLIHVIARHRLKTFRGRKTGP